MGRKAGRGGKGRGDEEWKSDEMLSLWQGERATAARRASRSVAGGQVGGGGQRTVLQVERANAWLAARPPVSTSAHWGGGGSSGGG